MTDTILPTIPRAELTSIIYRLEAATSRLEDIASATVEAPKTNGQAPTPAPTDPLPPAPSETPVPAPEPARALAPLLPQSVEEFDSFITGTLKKFVNLSDEVGGPVAAQVCYNSKI
jgi:adenylyl cyclase-associated protein